MVIPPLSILNLGEKGGEEKFKKPEYAKLRRGDITQIDYNKVLRDLVRYK